MILRGFFLLLAPVIVLATGALAFANVSVRPLVTLITAEDDGFADILVQNDGSQRAFLEIQPARIENPGLPTERRVESPNPAEIGLLATPQRMILEPGASRVVRIALLERDKPVDQVFRVLVENVSGGLSGAEEQVSVGMLISFDTLVIARPEAPRADLVVEREADAFTVLNTGNSAALLFEGSACADNACRPLELVRLYSGASVSYQLQANETASFQVEHPDMRRDQLQVNAWGQ